MFVALCQTLCSTLHLSCAGETRTGHSTPGMASPVPSRSGITSLSQQAALCLMPDGTPLAFFAARTHCCLVLTLVPTRTHRVFSDKLPSSRVYTPAECIPLYILVHGVGPPQVQDFALSFLNSMRFLCRNGVSAIPPRFVTSANLLRTRCAPSSRSCSTSQDAKQEQSQH